MNKSIVDIPWYVWYYQVNTEWEIISIPRKWRKSKRILKSCNSGKWYKSVTLCKDWEQKALYIHRLVYMSFMWPIWEGMYVCHKNDIRSDNRLENLFLWTPQDNIDDMFRKWRDRIRWEENHKSKLSHQQVLEIRNLCRFWFRQKDIANEYWVSQSCVSEVFNRKRYSCVI
jgi:hypothetical protein